MWQHIFFITASDGGHIALGTVSRDLSERKQAEARIEAAQSHLAHMARVSTMGELAAAIAHDVNQPLAAVVTNANACIRWLGNSPPDAGEAAAAASRIVVEGRRASEVLDRIRILMKKGPLKFGPVDLNEIVQQVLQLVRSQVSRHGIALRLKMASELPYVQGDPVQLQQVLLNLVVNAIEATAAREDGGREIRVMTQAILPAEASVAVSDSGVGIDSAQTEKLFQPFFTTKATGMGMGLAISRTIIGAHGGRLGAARNEGPGATFQFWIPAMVGA
jgi:C4-dicarboxylate-specific signal transduction histidine kinase